jgi:hypothetical protein
MFVGEEGNRDLDSFSQDGFWIVERPLDGSDQAGIL